MIDEELLALRTEFAEARVGMRIYERVSRLVRRTVRRYPPEKYAGAGTWEDAVDDVTHEVFLDRLLNEGQLEYALEVARSIRDFDALIIRQVRRTLAHRRVRGVIDNLLARIERLLRNPPYTSGSRGRSRVYSLAGRTVDDRQPRDDEIRLAAAAVAAIPRLRPRARERAPAVYSPVSLADVVKTVATVLPTPFGIADLDRILTLALTPYASSGLELALEESSDQPTGSEVEDSIMSSELVDRVLAALGDRERQVLRLALGGATDGQIGAALGVSRQTAWAARRRVASVLRDAVEGTSVAVRDRVAANLSAKADGGLL